MNLLIYVVENNFKSACTETIICSVTWKSWASTLFPRVAVAGSSNTCLLIVDWVLTPSILNSRCEPARVLLRLIAAHSASKFSQFVIVIWTPSKLYGLDPAFHVISTLLKSCQPHNQLMTSIRMHSNCSKRFWVHGWRHWLSGFKRTKKQSFSGRT